MHAFKLNLRQGCKEAFRGNQPVEGWLDVPEEVEGQLLGFILAVHLVVFGVLGCSERVCEADLQREVCTQSQK